MLTLPRNSKPKAMTHMPLNVEQLPTRRDEAWKWTDVRGRAAEQGGLSAAGLPKFTLPEGVSVSESVSDEGTDAPMAKLARSLSGSVWTITVPEGFKAETALVIEGLNRGHIRIRLELGKGAALSVIEHHAGDTNGFVNLDMTITLKEGAAIERTLIHNDPESCLRVATTHITAWAGAKISQYALSFGGDLSRLETRVAIMGTQVEAVLNGAYLLRDKRHIDMTSYIDLAVPDCTIRQAVKGVVTDKARGVFQGKFHVRRPAQHTDAEMRHDALMLSDTSEIRSKPELEIYADDVACAHGNTIGQLDESALFYMRQRGIPVSEARALLTEAFVADVFDDMSDEELKESLLGKIREWLGA